LFRNAADAGLDTAQFDLASCYEAGQGVPQAFGVAAEWYRKASQQGNPAAQNNLASMYQSGRGVPQDPVRAVRLFLLAAENGNMKAAINLANTFHRGIGVKPDSVLSCMWLQVASDAGKEVGGSLHAACSEISDHQLNQARQQALTWRAQHHLAVAISTTSSVAPEFSPRH
jgi:TPR repeat protein